MRILRFASQLCGLAVAGQLRQQVSGGSGEHILNIVFDQNHSSQAGTFGTEVNSYCLDLALRFFSGMLRKSAITAYQRPCRANLSSLSCDRG